MTFKVKDHYFHKAKKENFLARSVYKLEEIDQRYKISKKNRGSRCGSGTELDEY
jgi:23S rRNA (uridine2552-2'-O)-methyltransferase